METWTFIILYALLIIMMPTLWIVAWRSKFMLEKHMGTRAEVRRERLSIVLRMNITAWLLMVLIEIEHIVRVVSVSHDFRLFWFGFQSASFLFLVPVFVLNINALLRQEREKMRRRLQRKDVV